MKDFFFFVVGIVFILGSFYIFLTKPAPERYQVRNKSLATTTAMIIINGRSIDTEVAETDEERRLGLSGRDKLGAGRGLILAFNNSDYHGIWMRDMNFAIDIVWIDEDWVVAGSVTDVTPDSYPEVFYPPRPIKYVLELPAGSVSEFGIITGSSVTI